MEERNNPFRDHIDKVFTVVVLAFYLFALVFLIVGLASTEKGWSKYSLPQINSVSGALDVSFTFGWKGVCTTVQSNSQFTGSVTECEDYNDLIDLLDNYNSTFTPSLASLSEKLFTEKKSEQVQQPGQNQESVKQFSYSGSSIEGTLKEDVITALKNFRTGGELIVGWSVISLAIIVLAFFISSPTLFGLCSHNVRFGFSAYGICTAVFAFVAATLSWVVWFGVTKDSRENMFSNLPVDISTVVDFTIQLDYAFYLVAITTAWTAFAFIAGIVTAIMAKRVGATDFHYARIQ